MVGEHRRLLELAIANHRQGRLQDAIVLYRSVPVSAPERLDAIHMIGVALLQLGRAQEAEAYIAEEIKARPLDAGAHYNLGLARRGCGRLDASAHAFERALALKADYPEALVNLGIVREYQQRPEEAVLAYKAALQLQPRNTDAWTNLASAFTALGRHGEALAAADRAAGLDPARVAAHLNRGTVLQRVGRIDEAILSYRRALALAPDHAATHCNLGIAYQTLGRHPEAAEHYQRCTALDPGNFQAWHRLGGVLHLLDRFPEALAASETAVRLDPRSAAALVNLGSTLQSLGRLADAEVKYRAGLALAPDLPLAWVNLGSVLRLMGRLDEAVAACHKALALNPLLAEAELTLANTLQDFDRDAEALDHFDKALELDPNLGEASRHKALLLLRRGDLAAGWDLNESRWELIDKRQFPRYFSHPEWQGEKISDGVLLAWGEQGLGDQILNASIVGDLGERANRVVVEVDARLVPLFARSFPDYQVRAIDSNDFTDRFAAQVAFSSLGRVFRRHTSAFPDRPSGYLRANAALVAQLRERLKRPDTAVIGLSWISKNPNTGALKTSRLLDFESVLRIAGCRFIDLQYGDTADERAGILRELGVAVERLADIDNTNDIDGLAALVCACDAVVTVSNTTAHLAGALGVKTWVAVPVSPARPWHWFNEGARTPWYPRVHVCRQGRGQGWASLLAGATPDIQAFADSVKA